MRQSIRFFIVSFFLFTFITLTVHSQDMTGQSSPRSMQGIRPLGMGGAFIAVDGSDENALFYNPAAINDFEKKVHMQFLLPTVEFSYKAISFSDDIRDLADDIDDSSNDTDKLDSFNNFTAANAGRYEEARVHGSIANLMHKYIAASLFYENRTAVQIHGAPSNTIDIEAMSQGGLQVGSALNFFDNHLQAGVALKFMERHLIEGQITQTDVVTDDNFGDSIETDRMGFGIGGDIGLKAKLPIKGKTWHYLDPRFALTLQDIGDTRFFTGDNVGEQSQCLSAGLALHPHYGKLKSVFALDVRDLDHETDFINKLHAGYEVTWPKISKFLRSISARIGLDQGYITGGLGLDFKYFKFNFATYGHEVGTETLEKESRLFGFQVAAGF